jgi:hypothetical protein
LVQWSFAVFTAKCGVTRRRRLLGTKRKSVLDQSVARMTPVGTPELVLLLVALGGMPVAATWAVIELNQPRR